MDPGSGIDRCRLPSLASADRTATHRPLAAPFPVHAAELNRLRLEALRPHDPPPSLLPRPRPELNRRLSRNIASRPRASAASMSGVRLGVYTVSKTVTDPSSRSSSRPSAARGDWAGAGPPCMPTDVQLTIASSGPLRTSSAETAAIGSAALPRSCKSLMSASAREGARLSTCTCAPARVRPTITARATPPAPRTTTRRPASASIEGDRISVPRAAARTCAAAGASLFRHDSVPFSSTTSVLAAPISSHSSPGRPPCSFTKRSTCSLCGSVTLAPEKSRRS